MERNEAPKKRLPKIYFVHSVLEFVRDRQYRNLLITSSIIICFGSVFYHFQEGWSWVDSFYFSVITLTTIGYGDLAPSTDLGKIFTILYIILGLGMILSFINAVYEHYRNQQGPKQSKNMSKKPSI